VIGRAVTPSILEGAGRSRLTPPEMPTTWHYALQPLDPPNRPAAFRAQPNTRPCARRNQTETFFSQSRACWCASCHHHL